MGGRGEVGWREGRGAGVAPRQRKGARQGGRRHHPWRTRSTVAPHRPRVRHAAASPPPRGRRAATTGRHAYKTEPKKAETGQASIHPPPPLATYAILDARPRGGHGRAPPAVGRWPTRWRVGRPAAPLPPRPPFPPPGHTNAHLRHTGGRGECMYTVTTGGTHSLGRRRAGLGGRRGTATARATAKSSGDAGAATAEGGEARRHVALHVGSADDCRRVRRLRERTGARHAVGHSRGLTLPPSPRGAKAPTRPLVCPITGVPIACCVLLPSMPCWWWMPRLPVRSRASLGREWGEGWQQCRPRAWRQASPSVYQDGGGGGCPRGAPSPCAPARP